MALVHEFEMFESEKDIVFNSNTRKSMVKLDDYFVLYAMDTLMWIPSYCQTLEKKEFGLDYYGRTLFDQEGIARLLKIVISWQEVFSNAPEEFELTTGFIIEDNVFYKEKVEKRKLLSQLNNLENLCNQAIKKQMLIVHFGI